MLLVKRVLVAHAPRLLERGEEGAAEDAKEAENQDRQPVSHRAARPFAHHPASLLLVRISTGGHSASSLAGHPVASWSAVATAYIDLDFEDAALIAVLNKTTGRASNNPSGANPAHLQEQQPTLYLYLDDLDDALCNYDINEAAGRSRINLSGAMGSQEQQWQPPQPQPPLDLDDAAQEYCMVLRVYMYVCVHKEGRTRRLKARRRFRCLPKLPTAPLMLWAGVRIVQTGSICALTTRRRDPKWCECMYKLTPPCTYTCI